jgi:hypothetical protein
VAGRAGSIAHMEAPTLKSTAMVLRMMMAKVEMMVLGRPG